MTSELRAETDEVRFGGEQPLAAQGVQVAHSGRRRRASEERSSYREVFAVGEFRAPWSAQVVTNTGDQFAQVAIAILVLRPHPLGVPHRAGPRAYLPTYLPPSADGPLLSGLADLFPRRRVMSPVACSGSAPSG